MDKRELARDILLPQKGDRLNGYRTEYNEMLMDKALGATAMVQDKYVTVSVFKSSVEDARAYFARVGRDQRMMFALLTLGLY